MTTCTIHRWLWSRSRDAGRSPSAWSGRHLARCTACREAVLAGERLDDALRAAAPSNVAPDGFEIRAMVAVRAAARERPAVVPALSWSRPVWATAAACAVLALALWGRDRAEERAVAQAGARAAMSATVAVSDWIAAWGDNASGRLTGPMQTEVDNLVADARRAAGVLLAGLD